MAECATYDAIVVHKFARGATNMSSALLLAVFVCSLTVAEESKPQPTTLANEGTPVCSIVISPQASPVERHAAAELQHWLQEITTAEFPLTDGLTAHAIVLGTWDHWQNVAGSARCPPTQPEGYRILSDGARLWIMGRGDLAVQHAVYDLLESLGCRWFFPDPVWTVVPRQRNLVVNIDRTVVPAFGYRRIWYGWGPRTDKLAQDYQVWLEHNRQLGSFQVACGHSYDGHIPAQEFQAHPEWFSLVNGQRQPFQLCTSHPEVQRRVIEHVLETFRKNPQLNMVSVEPNDGDRYCECDNCQKLGTPSDRVFHLANVVAEAVRKEFPDKWVGLYAYAGHSEPPHFGLNPGVYVQVTTGFRYTKLSFEEQVAAFRKLGATVGVYDYFSVYPWDWDLPGAAKAGRTFELAAAIRHYHELGLTTYDAESSCNWGPNGLGYWIAAHLMWDPALNPESLLADFCEKAFGEAAPQVAQIYRRWAKGERFSRRNLKLALLDLKNAYGTVRDDATRVRLDHLAMYLHWLCLWSDYEHAARWNQWGHLAVAPPEEVRSRAKAFLAYTRRIMDTGLVHAFPALYTEWLNQRMAGLGKVPGFQWEEVKQWIDKTDIPGPQEVAQAFAEDLAALADLAAVEIAGRTFASELVPLAEHEPEIVTAWGDVASTNIAVESGNLVFFAEREEQVRIDYRPFDAGHTIDCHWRLFPWPAADSDKISEGQLRADKGQPATIQLAIPHKGLWLFEPGTDYWRAAVLGFDSRPASFWAGRADGPGPQGRPFRLWRPQLDQPLFFYVPAETRSFVVGIVEGGDPFTTLQIKNAQGEVICEAKLLPGDQVSVDWAKRASRDQSGTGAVRIRGEVLSLALDSLRCVVELYDVPPYLARQPRELLVPQDALRNRP